MPESSEAGLNTSTNLLDQSAGGITAARIYLLSMGTAQTSEPLHINTIFQTDNTIIQGKLEELHLSLHGHSSDRPSYRSIQFENVMQAIECDYIFIFDNRQVPSSRWFLDSLNHLQSGHADLLIHPAQSQGIVNQILNRFVGLLTKCKSPESNAMAFRKSAIASRHSAIRPAGKWLSVELQLRVPSEKCTFLADTNASAILSPVPRKTEFSFIKSFIDHRFGNASRLIQFCAVGFSGMLIDLTFYALFQEFFRNSGLKNYTVPIIGGTFDLAIAGFLAVWLAMSWNFILNRRLTFNDARRNSSIFRQYVTYATGNALAIGVSLLIRLWLPTQIAFFNDHKLAAALVGIILATGISFSMARYFVFKS